MQHEEHSHHIIPVRTYVIVFTALMVLMAITIGVAFLPLGVFGKPVALTIAVTKAGLIMAFFMHLKYSSKLTLVIASMGFFWLIIMLVITMGDYVARGTIPGTLGPQSVFTP